MIDAWYVVEEDSTLTEIEPDMASEIIAIDMLKYYEVDYYIAAYIDFEGYPRIIRGVPGLEGEMV